MYIQKRDSLPSDRVYMPFQRLHFRLKELTTEILIDNAC